MLIRTNVKNIGDPFIVAANNKYYMYGTSPNYTGFNVRESQDLINWKDLGICLDLSNSWCYQDFWAPEVIYHDSKYVMHFTSRRKSDDSLRLGVAISDSPTGPFVEVKKEPMFDLGYAAIDGHVFIDEDNQPYLYFSKDCSENIVDGKHTSQIMCAKMNKDLTEIICEPILLLTPIKEYEGVNDEWRWNEGPFVIKKNDIYYLMYSANYFASKEYCICLAKSNNPLGPFIKEDKPILSYKSLKNNFSGPGHNAVFKDYDGTLKTSFHIHTNPLDPSQCRSACVADLEIFNNKIIIKL